MNPDSLIRPVQKPDLPAVAAIYNHYVLNSTCTFATDAANPAYWEDWFSDHADAHPAFVAQSSGRILGWASLSQWNSRCAYHHTVEDSVYVDSECHRRGIGFALLSALIHRARDLGHTQIIAQIADHQAPSYALHARLGFRQVGLLSAVGRKFDRWIDVALWQLSLAP